MNLGARSSRFHAAAAFALGAALLALPAGVAAGAEKPAAKPAPAAKAAPATPAPAPAPPAAPQRPAYEPQLLRVAEMMGALAYLSDLCGMGDAADFRTRIAALLDAQASDEQRRDLIAGAYNKGFRDYATNYHACGPAAREVIERYLNETARLAADLASRYGG